MIHLARERQSDGGPILLLAGWALVVMVWFFFAFASAQGDLAWLASAQAACFGSAPDGLPTPWGWAVLLLSPLSFLLGIVGAFGRDLSRGLRVLTLDRRFRAIMFLLVVGFVLEGMWVGKQIQRGQRIAAIDYGPSAKGPFPADWPRLDRSLPSIALIDQHGKRVALNAPRVRPQLLTFVFSHCATVCPFLIRNTVEAATLLDGQVGLTYIALDPWRDTVSALPSLAERWALPAEARLLSGDVPTVVKALRKLGVPSARDLKSGDIEHPALVYVLDKRGRIAYALNNPSPLWLVQAVRRLEGR